MPITFQVLRSELEPEHSELLVTGRVSDGILVTGMIATGSGHRGAIQELETLDDADHGPVFRLTFHCPQGEAEEEAEAWRRSWDEGTEISLAY